jgi:hypothetical protein
MLLVDILLIYSNSRHRHMLMVNILLIMIIGGSVVNHYESMVVPCPLLLGVDGVTCGTNRDVVTLWGLHVDSAP